MIFTGKIRWGPGISAQPKIRIGVNAECAIHNASSSGFEENMKCKIIIHRWLFPNKFARCLPQLALQVQVQVQLLPRASLDLRLP